MLIFLLFSLSLSLSLSLDLFSLPPAPFFFPSRKDERPEVDFVQLGGLAPEDVACVQSRVATVISNNLGEHVAYQIFECAQEYLNECTWPKGGS